eukprot:16426959-Heterocapsa_arctica.AAC.1
MTERCSLRSRPFARGAYVRAQRAAVVKSVSTATSCDAGRCVIPCPRTLMLCPALVLDSGGVNHRQIVAHVLEIVHRIMPPG